MAKLTGMRPREHRPFGEEEAAYALWLETRAKVMEALSCVSIEAIITERALAHTIGLSLDTVRAALEQLEQEGRAERSFADPTGRLVGWRSARPDK